jgi:hypothetical protein
MATVSHQTVRLSRGKHSSPEEGTCVMELASMLAGEEFSDHPRSVCPVIGSFLRTYNDLIDDDRRQDLYAYAARVVASRSTKVAERQRAARCVEWLEEPTGRTLLPGTTWRLGPWRSRWAADRAAKAAARSTRPDAHRRALALIDGMLSAREERQREARAGTRGSGIEELVG